MFNNRTNTILKGATFVDEYENATLNYNNNENAFDVKEANFNSKISDNFDRIMHYDSYNRQSNVRQTNEVYNNYVSGNVDVNPTSTTMQFQNVKKEDIYQDYKVTESSYAVKSRVNAKSKLAIIVGVIIMAMLSVLIILNTALLNKMTVTTSEKLSEVATLEQQYREKQADLDAVSNDDYIKEIAKNDYGMIEGVKN